MTMCFRIGYKISSSISTVVKSSNFEFCIWPVPKNSAHVPQLLKLLEILETRVC